MQEKYQYPPEDSSNDEFEPEDSGRTLKSSAVPQAPQSDYTQTTKDETPDSGAVIEAAPPPPPPLTRERARERVRRRHSRRKGGEWAWVIIAGTLLTLVAVLGFVLLVFLRSSSGEATIMPTSVVDYSTLPTPVNFRTDAEEVTTGQSITLDNGYSMVLEPWDGTTRFTVLVMGLDRRPGETGLAYRTDTMMLLSVDPQTNTAGILSIPRDLYVVVEGYAARQRVNSAMVLGEVNQSGYGPELAMRVIQNNLGIRVHDYIAVDFQAVIDIIDAVGGITVTTDYTINDPEYPDMYYGYDPFYLPAGEHNLAGTEALKFARTRHGDSDIERTRRQQQVIFAIRDQVVQLDQLPQLIIRAPSLLASMEDNVYTSMELQQMIELAWFVKDIPAESIQTGVMDYRYLTNWRTAQGAQVLIPNNNTLPELMVGVFGPDYSQ